DRFDCVRRPRPCKAFRPRSPPSCATMQPMRGLVVALAAALRRAALPPAPRSAWETPHPPVRIVGNLYYLGTADLACYLLTTSEGHILVNTGLESSAGLIRDSIEALGYRYKDIRILLTNQAHYDHVAAFNP